MANPSTPNPSPGGIPLRALTAWTLLALTGVLILSGLLAWSVPPSGVDQHAQLALSQFTSIMVLVPPLLAVLVAARLGPPVRQATLLGLVALVEYATALVLGGLAYLVSLPGRFENLDGDGIRTAGAVLQEIGGALGTLLVLVLLALAGLWTHHIFTGLGGRLPRVRVRPD